MKKLAIQFYGCVRTYKKTYKSFFKNVVEVNKNDGWEIDIFIHTWDVFEKSGSLWHSEFPTLDGIELTQADQEDIQQIYNPKKFLVEHLGNRYGQRMTKQQVVKLTLEYEKETNIVYDYYLTTRLDIYFCTPLRLNDYLDPYWYPHHPIPPLPSKHTFCPSNLFMHYPVMDLRFVNEGSLVYFSNFAFAFNEYEAEDNKNNLIILIDYLLFQNFFIYRENGLPCFETNQNEKIEQENEEIRQEQEYEERLEKTNIELCQNHIKSYLCYKLGLIMIHYNENFLSRIKMPYLLLVTSLNHKAEQKTKNLHSKSKSELLQKYKNHKKVIELKEHLSYKLGEALIKAFKNKWGGGLLKFLFVDVRRIKREFKQKKKNQEKT